LKNVALLLIGLLSACAGTTQIRSDQVTVTARHLSDACALTDQTIGIHVENRAAKPISFSLGMARPEPPYYLYAESFHILFRSTPESELEFWKPNFDHYLPPEQKLVLGPGEATDFLVSVPEWTLDDLSKTFVVHLFSDVQRFPSNFFTLCPSRSAPNSPVR
jgi:hypothetical protein